MPRTRPSPPADRTILIVVVLILTATLHATGDPDPLPLLTTAAFLALRLAPR
ncbi:hypothetical protein [Kitasatospora griseola]|uniref:hypothetical protein n=1 Tax=Kitasatospora griseola TaxID=2064 RepID=UPI003813A3B0